MDLSALSPPHPVADAHRVDPVKPTFEINDRPSEAPPARSPQAATKDAEPITPADPRQASLVGQAVLSATPRTGQDATSDTPDPSEALRRLKPYGVMLLPEAPQDSDPPPDAPV